MSGDGQGRRPRHRRLVRAAIVLGVLGLLLGAGCMTSLVESMTFYHPGGVPPPAWSPMEDVWFTTEDGLRLHAWFIPPRGARPAGERAPAVLHAHGNAGNIENHIAFSDFLADAGIGVLLFDYRGFGHSERDGPLTREGLMRDTRAAFEALRTRPDVDPERLGVYGYSLGGAFALALAAERPEVRAVCTIVAFSSWRDVAGDFIPLLGPALIGAGLDPDDSASRLGQRPWLIVHGERDFIVRPRHAKVLEEAGRTAGVPVERLDVPRAGHADDVILGPVMREAVSAFFARTLGAGTSPAPAAHEPSGG